MNSLVLTYVGPPERLAQAEAELRRRYPLLKLRRKTDSVFEGQSVDLSPSENLLLGAWKVTPMAYAEINPPGLNLGGLSRRLAALGLSRKA